jgi:hypothetical protein
MRVIPKYNKRQDIVCDIFQQITTVIPGTIGPLLKHRLLARLLSTSAELNRVKGTFTTQSVLLLTCFGGKYQTHDAAKPRKPKLHTKNAFHLCFGRAG